MQNYIVCLMLILSGCRFLGKVKNEKMFEYSYKDHKGKIIAKGFVDGDTLQTGKWEYYEDTTVVRTGRFCEGLMLGRWNYNYKDFRGIIDWDTIMTLKGLRINYPNDFVIKDNSKLKLISSDSVLEIDIYIENTKYDMNSLESKAFHKIANDSLTISKISCRKLIYKEQPSYSYFCDTYKGMQCGLYYITTISSSDNCLIVDMYSKNFDPLRYQFYMTIYLGIINNLFIEQVKIVDFYQVTEAPC